MKASVTRARVAANLASNYANLALLALATLVVTPIYVRALGPEQWAVVALCITLQGVMFSVDLAMGPVMMRDVAQSHSGRDLTRVVRRYFWIYVGAAVCIALVVELALFGGFAIGINRALFDSGERLLAIELLLVQFCCQFSNNAALGFWNGLERQGFANRRVAFFLTLKHGLALYLVLGYEASAISYLLPFAAVSAVEFIVNGMALRRGLQLETNARGEMPTLAAAGPAASAQKALPGNEFLPLALLGALGVLSSQIDRVVLAIALPAEAYGRYFLVSTLVLSVLSLQVPIQRAFLPRVAASPRPLQAAAMMLLTSIILLSLPCLAVATVPQWALQLWLRGDTLAAADAEIFRWMLIGVSLMVTYSSVSALLLCERAYKGLIAVAVFVLLAQLTLLFTFVGARGAAAAAYGWLAWGIIHVCAVVWIGGRRMVTLRSERKQRLID